MSRPNSVEYFQEELHRFRAAFSDRRNSLEKLDKMFAGLSLVASLTEGENLPGWDAMCVEWPLRRAYMAAYSTDAGGK